MNFENIEIKIDDEDQTLLGLTPYNLNLQIRE